MCITLFSTFFLPSIVARLPRETSTVSSFTMEDVNARQRFSLSFSELRYSSLESTPEELRVDTSQLLFLARHRHCLGIGSQLDNAANLFILLFRMKLYHVHLAPDFLPCLHSMITLSYNIRFLMIDEMSQSKLVNH